MAPVPWVLLPKDERIQPGKDLGILGCLKRCWEQQNAFAGSRRRRRAGTRFPKESCSRGHDPSGTQAGGKEWEQFEDRDGHQQR